MCNSDQNSFGISCLELIQNDPFWKMDLDSSLNSSELSNQVKHIYSQWKQFIQHSRTTRKQPTKQTYQNVIRLQNDLEKFFQAKYDLEWLSIKNMLIILKTYQNIFSSVNTENLLKDVNNYIEIIQPTNVNSQIASLTFIQSFATKYQCIGMIDLHLKKFFSEKKSIEQTVDDNKFEHFQILFQFMHDCIRLLKLLTQHVIYGSEYILDTLYTKTPNIINHIENIFRSTVSLIDLNDNEISVSIKQPQEHFYQMQTELNKYFDEMRFTPFIVKYKLENFVSSIAPLFQKRSSIDETTQNQSKPTTNNPSISTEKNRRQLRINECMKKLNDLLIKADKLPVRPHEILNRIRHILGQLQSIDINKGTEGEIQMILAKEQILTTEINSYIQELKRQPILKCKLPQIQSASSLTHDEIHFDNAQTRIFDYENEFEKEQKQIRESSSSESFYQLEQIGELINQQVSNRIWLESLSILSSKDWISTDLLSNQLKRIMSSLNNHLSIQLERILSSTDENRNEQQISSLVDNITVAYIKFRLNLLESELKFGRICNFEIIAKLSSALNDWKQVYHVHFLNMFESIQSIMHHLIFTRNCIKNYTIDSNCCLLPVVLRPEDILCLITPEQSESIRIISSNYTKIDNYLSNPTLMEFTFDKTSLLQCNETVSSANTIQINTGLSSFIYNNDRNQSLINYDKHLNYIIEKAFIVSKQLIDLCVDSGSQNGYLMKVATSVTELFPIQIVSALSLIILINWSGLSLSDFEYSNHLDFLSLKVEELTINGCQNELQKLEQTCLDENEQIQLLERQLEKAWSDHNFTDHSIQKREAKVEINRLENIIADEKHLLNKNKEKAIFMKRQIEQDKFNFDRKRAFEQQKWLEQIIKRFQSISIQVQRCVKLIEEMCTDQSTSVETSTTKLGVVLLDIATKIAAHQLAASTLKSITNDNLNELKQIKLNIKTILDDLNNDASLLADKEIDPMYLFLQFYSNVMQVGLDAMSNSMTSWTIYSKKIQTKQMLNFVKLKKRKEFCDLSIWTQQKCTSFIEKVRRGHEITKLEEEISRRIHTDIGNLSTILTGDNSDYIQQSLGQYQRFIYKLLIAGCRYIQVQRGSTPNSLDDLVSPIIREQIDSSIPHTESNLLQIINTSEVQFRSQCESLTYQIVHMAFGFNTNVFSLIEKLDTSIKTVDQLLLPSSYMIVQLWGNIDTLLNSISNKMTTDEYDILKELCKTFSLMNNVNERLKDEDLFLSERLDSGFVGNLFILIETLRHILEKNRSKMKRFCDNLFVILHTTLKEIIRGFIKSQKYRIETLIELNNRKRKSFHLLFDEKHNNGDIQFADIKRISENKEILFSTSLNNKEQRFVYLSNLKKSQMLYFLLRGLIDNLENIVMNMSLEPINYDFLKKLLETISLFYVNGQNTLKSPLIKFILNENDINQELDNLEKTWRLEKIIFLNQVSNSNSYLKKHIDDIISAINEIQLCSQLAQDAKRNWNKACDDLIESRREKRVQNENVIVELLKHVGSFFKNMVSSKHSSSPKDNREIYNHYFERIHQFMLNNQWGNASIFIVAPQGPIQKLSKWLRNNADRIHDELFQEFKFEKVKRFIEVNITCKCSSPHEMKLRFSTQSKSSTDFQLSLTSTINTFKFINTTELKSVVIKSNKHDKNEIEWKDAIKRSHNISDDHTIRFLYVLPSDSNGITYTVADNLNRRIQPNEIEGIENFDKMEQELDAVKQKHDSQIQWTTDQEKMLNSPIKHFVDQLSSNFENISNSIKYNMIQDIPNIIKSTNLTDFYKQLPRIETLKQAKDGCVVRCNYIFISNSIVSLNDINEKDDINKQFTSDMLSALNTSENCPVQMQQALDIVISRICDIRVRFLISYAWSYSVANDEINSSATFMKNILKENEEYYSLLDKNNENSNRIINWVKLTQQAEYIYRTTSRRTNKWQEIGRLMKTPLMIDENIENAFLNSRSAGDAHVWFYNLNESSQGTIHMTYEPQLALVDFGIVFSGIRQRLVQQILLHNETDKDINIQLERHHETNPNEFDFNMTPDTVIVSANSIAEIDVLFKSPENFIGDIHEMLDINIDNQQLKFNSAIQLRVQMVKVDLEIGSGAVKIEQFETEFWQIDFGSIPCAATPVVKSIELKNVLESTIQVKAQVQTNEKNYQSHLNIVKNDLTIDGKTTTMLNLTLQPTEMINIDEDFEAIVCLAITPSKNIKWLKVKASICRPQLSLSYQNRLLIENSNPINTLTISDFYLGEHRLIPFELKNTGQTDFSLSLTSTNLDWKCENANLQINQLKTIEIPIKISQQNRSTFNVNIQFINNKRRFQFQIICETSIPRLKLPTMIKKTIEISQSAHLLSLYDSDTKSLKSILFEETFKNEGKAAVTLSFNRFLSTNRIDPLNINFLMKPNNFKILPNSEIKVNFIYQPTYLCDLKGYVEVESNCWENSKTIEFSLEFRKPNFRSSPQSIIEWGKIEINRTNQLLFEVKNIGANPLRFITRSVKTKQPFVNEAFISSTAMEINSINHPFRVNPNDKVRFSINIKSSSIDSNQIEPSPIELAELDLQSLCDPVMSIDGQLQDRSIKIFVIGRLDKYDPINEIRLIGSKPKDWSNLRLIPTKDIREIEQNMNKHEPYSLFITMTCAAYAARSNEIIAIPKIKDDYETLVGKVHLAAKHLTAPLSLKDICGKVSIDVIRILYKYFQLTVDQPEYFHHSISLHNSLYSIHSGIPIRLQLYAIVNSTNNNDEAYTMQSYATTILSVYENINEKENLCCQSLQTIDKCIGKDPLMPECLRSFIEYIRLVTKPTTDLNEIEHLLADRIGSSSGLRDLLGSNLNDNKWTLRFSCIPNEIKEIVIALIEQENNSYSSLLSCHLAAASLDKYAGWQNSLLQGLKWARKLWIDINEKEQLNLLSGIFSDQIKLADLLTRLESKNDFKRTVIEATESILNYLNCSNYFLNVVTIYQCASSKRFDLLWNLGFRDYKIRYALELHIDSCKATRNLNDFVHQFCEILRIILVLEAHQWISVRTSVYNFCVLFSRILNANVNTVNQILIDSMSLAAEFRSNTIFWSKIQEEFKQVVCNPESDTLKSFIHTMAAIDDKNSSKSEIQKMITQINHINSMEPNETTFEHVFQLCQMIMTNEQLIQFRQKCEKIEEIPSTSSIVDALSNMQSIVSDSVEFQQSIKAYLFLVQLPNNLTANEDDQTQYELLEQIIPSWLIIMNEKSKINQSFFNIISSVLTSFHGLLLSRGISFKERLYTMVLINALCLLSNYRFMKHSLTDQSQQSKRTSISLVESIRQKLIRQIQSAPITSKPSIPSVDNDPVESINTPQPTRPRLTKQASIVTTTHPYSIAMLAKMSDFMKKYADQRTSQQRTFEDSDKLCDIVQQIINNHQNIDLWLSAFTTFIRILRYNVDLDSTTTTVQARDIIEHGLQLLLNSLAIKRILEPSFSSTGVIFIDNDISRIEKCLLSLALENSPLLRHTLYQLHVDVSRIKQILPSRIFSPIPPSPPLLRTDNNSKDTSPPDTYDGVHNPISTDKPILDRPMNGSDWLKEMKNDDALSIKDTPGTNTGNSRKPTTFTKFDTSQDNKINRIQPLVNNLLPTGFDIQTTAGIGTTSTTYDSLEADMENMDAANIKLDLTESALREHMKKQAEIIEQYRKSNSKTTDNKSHETLQDRGKLEFNKKIEHWTYQKLVQSKTIAWIIDTMLEEFQKRWEQLLNNRVNQLEVRWCIMIDNSGSMSLHRNLIYESLVILMELLRKMEFKFSVARFGGRTNQKILKDIDQLFTDQDGQFILEAISLDEGTYPATGLARIADKIFPVTTSEPNAHQFVLMITDGLTQEREEKSFSTTINKNKINLGIMFIESIEHSSSELLLSSLANLIKHKILKGNAIKTLPTELAELMSSMLDASINIQNAAGRPPSISQVIPEIKIEIPMFDTENQRKISPNEIIDNSTYQSQYRLDYKISKPNAPIPKFVSIEKQKISDYLSPTRVYTNYSAITEELRQFYQTFTIDPTRNDEQIWDADEQRLMGLIDELTTVFSDVVFPINKLTRRRAALRGSSLYLPGLIKAMTTEWSYKKIFSAKLAGGKRDHAACIVLDVSTSMFGLLGKSLQETTITLIGALQKLGLENYGIIVFGSKIRLVKTNEQTWGSVCKTILSQQIRFDQDDETKDAQALECAIDLLKNSSTRGEKKIFIITDGYGNSGNLLPLVQQRADEANIDIIAMAIGDDRTNLHGCYKRYIRCTTPYGLPKALRALFDNDTSNESVDQPIAIKIRSDIPDDASDKDMCLTDIKNSKVFKDLIEKLQGEREKLLINSGDPPSHMRCDICFCIDCTGSMSRWLSETKVQMKFIIKEIKKQITEKYPSLKLQLFFSIVAFRDVGDRQPFEILDFTDNDMQIINFLDQLTAYGGEDQPEDVMGALNECLNLKNWSKSNARFIVLITDAPGHGRELNDDASDRYPSGTGHSVSSICDRLLQQDSEIEFMFCCVNPAATLKMQRAFETYYNAKKDQTGKEFKTIKLFGDQPIDSRLFHFVFILDESGSMSGYGWNSLLRAYQSFLDRRRNDQGSDDLFSVIQFQSTARNICDKKRLADTPRHLTMSGGGTSYISGLESADSVIANDRSNSSVVMIFMSDGEDGGSNPLPTMQNLRQKYFSNHKFVCHTIGFDDGAEPGSDAANLLSQLAQQGGGNAYSASTSVDLVNVFNRLAADCTVTGTLVAQFAEILSKEVSWKIMLDYL
ncbi:unnamed protein product [Rotaria magnacalcarata]|uniref:VWFA domain-containing protein n=1 Tax=Rotaria magnacalcarata TaxID=392030 RepID=A0A816VV31_9BILA|nr:unnamed protein product [Rotaria magnacalcarata]